MRSLRAVFACCLLGAVTLGATVVPRMSLGEIADSSERVIHGVVTRKWSAWDDSRRYIWTHYEIQNQRHTEGSGRNSLYHQRAGRHGGRCRNAP